MSSQVIFFYVLISVLLMLGFALAVIWFFGFAQKKIINSVLKQKEIEIEFQKELLTNTIKVQENERTRIARELHDDIGSSLNVANINIHLLRKTNVSPEVLEVIQRIEDAVIKSSNRTRTISHELMPPVFQNFGLVHALNEFVFQLNESSEINYSITNTKAIELKENFKLLHIYRIIQELINNSVKHTEAKNVNISFEKVDSDVILKYKDDGVGTILNEKSNGLGINNIKTRCELLQGKIDIDSTPGKGYSIHIKFPNYE